MPDTTFARLFACFSPAFPGNLSHNLPAPILPQTILAGNCESDGGGITPPPTGGGLVMPEYN